MWSDNYIVANMKKNVSAGETTFSPFLSDEWPLRIVGPGAPHAMSVSRIDTISLSDFGTPTQIPELRILKYDVDGTTVIADKTVNYTWMQANLPVIGDGTTAYKFEGLTMDPSNLWDPEETYPGGFKVSNVVKGSRVHDLAELVGGMGSGTTITFIASDGFETTLPYSSIYTNPAVQARQGDAIIAWWGDGQYVPKYADGMRLFFTPDGDHVYGHWDMHETLPSEFWRYNFQNGIQYPSSAGLSAKYITMIKVYSTPESDWTLELDGRDIGGVNYTVSKPFLEEAIACQFGADHKATYTDNSGRVWEGMPLWFFAGFVDDADQHSANAYNETKALSGYNIVITAGDGYNITISSRDIIRSSNYLLANSLNGNHIDESDENWPLRFTGINVTGKMTVKGVKSVKLVPLDKDDIESTSTLIAAGVGGTASAGSGGIYTKHSIFIPAGSLAQDTLIRIAEPDDTHGLTSAVEIGPTTTFSLPATITVEYKAGDVPQGHNEDEMRLLVWEENQWKEVPGSSVNIPDKTVSGITSHLSVYGAGVPVLLQQVGSIRVTSTPPGAKIFLDGADTSNVTPFTLVNIPVGNHDVNVTKSGYVTPPTQTKAVTKDTETAFDFTLNEVTTATITVVSPNGGETWKRGNAYPISWSYTGESGSLVSIVLFDGDTQVFTIVSNTPIGSGGSGSYTWSIPSDKPLSDKYKVRIQSTSQPTVKDLSNNYFSIVADTTPTGSIKVVSPNGGETWKRGNAYPISWSYTGESGSSVSIVLFDGDTQVFTIVSNTPIGSGGSGSYTWSIPSDKPLSDEYKVRIQSTSQPTVKDLSNNYFSIVADTTPTGSIKVVSPNGGETWKRGNAYPISWSYTGESGSSVSIVLFDGDTQVFTIVSNTPIGSGGSGSYTWSIPSDKPLSNEYKVRIQSTSQPTVKDLSNNYFSIGVGSDSSLTFHSPGIYRDGEFHLINSSNKFYSLNSNILINADQVFGYGIAGDLPIVGNWDGDGVETVGIYRNGAFYLRNSNTAGNADQVFGYGIAGDLPVVGDWDGDGVETVGIYRNGAFYLRNSNTAGNADQVFGYGIAGDLPVVGDWDGDGVETVGIYRNGAFYLRNSNTAGNADQVFGYGIAGDLPVVGDWDGDGVETVGIYRNGAFYLRNSNTAGNADQVFGYGIAGDLPVVGDWDGT